MRDAERVFAPDPIDLADFGEVRRRVVDPMLADLLRPGELTGVELVADYDWPRNPDDPWPEWLDSPFSTRPGDAPKSLFLILRADREEPHSVRLGELGFFRADVDVVAEQIADSLVDWIAESDFGRGEARQLRADLTFPAAVARVEGRPVVLLDMDAEDRAVLDAAGAATAPATLGLSSALVADLDAWTSDLGAELEALFSALERVQQARFNAEFAGRPPGLMRMVFAPRKKAAAARQRTEKAVAEAHLVRWSRLVAEHEPRRDALVERLRTELGPDFHVPTPPRIP